jgi:hypothetical protein
MAAKSRNSGLLTGVVFVLAWMAGTVLQDTKAAGVAFPVPTDGRDKVAEYFRTMADGAELNAGMQIVAGVALLWFAGIMAGYLRRQGRPGPAAGLVLAGGAVAAGTLLLGAGAMVSLTGSDLASSPGPAQALYQLAFWFGGPIHVAALGTMIAAAALGLGGGLPKWLTIAGLVIGGAGVLASLAVVVSPAIMFVPIGRFLGFLWLLISLIVLSRRRASTESPAAAV